ncbi:MAG: hypothetical protein WC889_15045 [Myxococcota bacterium]|jgi:hypothetical protein
MKTTSALLSVFAVLLAGCSSGGTNPADAGVVNYANWMSHYKAQLSGMNLKQIVLLGAHDSSSVDITASSPPCWGEVRSDPSEHIDAGPTPANLENALTQSAPILNQLQAGVRYLDLRVALQDGGYYSEHMWLSTPFAGDGGILDQLGRFLSSNPDEIIIITTDTNHIYSDTTDGGMATIDQTNAYFQMVQNALPLVTAPQAGADPTLVTLGSIWAGSGRIIYFGPPNIDSTLQQRVWVYDNSIDSKWQPDASTPDELVQSLNANVIAGWEDGGSPAQLHVLQAMTNDHQKLINAPMTNAAIISQLGGAWANVRINVVQVNDTMEAADAGIMPVLINRMIK